MPDSHAHPDGPPELVIAGGAATITLRRPREHNRIDPDDLDVLAAHLAAALASPETRAVVLTASGPTFSSGYTLGALLERLDHRFEDLLDAFERCPLPTICALNGSVYGGATDLALCCDIRIGVEDSRMFMPAARIGLHYPPGGLRRFVKELGPAATKRLFLTGLPVDAAAMLRTGFLTELVPREQLEPRVAEHVAAIAKCESSVVRSMKAQIDALAAGDVVAGTSREHYERTLRSPELRARLGALTAKKG